MTRPTCEQFAAAAAALEGVRYRPRGRSAETGLDCAGIVHAPAAAIGITGLPDRHDYDPLMPDPEMLLHLCREGMDEQDHSDMGTGRVGLCRWESQPDPRHLVVMLPRHEIVHVDAIYRRVTRVPASWLDSKLMAVFRLRGVDYGEPW